ncbi:MAG: DUF4384 domain-containing protein [Deltaproteobacteria bacterium]
MKKLLSAIVLVFMPLFSYASDAPVWVEADGSAYMGELDTEKDVIARAKIDAKQKAVDGAVGTFINSHTLVSNNQISEDLIYASVRGKAEKIEVIKEGWDGKDRRLYHVRLKALISPVYPEKGDGINVRLTLSKLTLKEGDEVKIFYQTDKEGYVYLFSVAADGSVTLLFPNSVNQDNLVHADMGYTFPPPDSLIKLKAMLLPGHKGGIAEEKIKIIATRKKGGIVPLGFQEGMFKVYDASSTGMISDLRKKLNKMEPSEWTEDTVVYSIEKMDGRDREPVVK